MILIKQMGMPSNCAECRLKDYNYNECKVTYRKISYYQTDYPRMPWCPLVEVEEYGPEGTLYKVK